MILVNPPLTARQMVRTLFPKWSRRMRAKWVLAKRYVDRRCGPRVAIGTNFHSTVYIGPTVQR